MTKSKINSARFDRIKEISREGVVSKVKQSRGTSILKEDASLHACKGVSKVL